MAARAQFGRFEFDARAGELRRGAAVVHLQGLPLRLLEQLLARPGELITRQELQQALWPGETYGAFADGLNTAIRKLREALDDDPAAPRFVATVPRRGYRWIAPLATPEPPPAPSVPAVSPRPLRWPWVAAALGAAALLWWCNPLPPPAVLRVAQITTRARMDTPFKPVSDGERVDYSERNGDHWELMQTSIAGGEPRRLRAPGPSAAVLDISLHSAQMLVGSFTARDGGDQLWTMPIEGGEAVRVTTAVTGGGTFSPHGRQIAFLQAGALWLMAANGEHPRRLRILPGPAGWLAWSPGGSRLRFTMDGGIWQVSITGSGLHPLAAVDPPGATSCCGAWTADGRYFVYTLSRNGRSNLWALRERGSLWRRSPRGPFQLTHGPDNPADGTPALAGNRLIFYNGIFRNEAVRLNPQTGAYAPDPDPDATLSTYSPDRAWIADAAGPLIRSRPGGGERLQLAGADFHPAFPRWSPDGRWIAFTGARTGQTGMVYLVPSGGGTVQPLPLSGLVQDVDWSPRGRRLVVSRAPDARQPETRALELFKLSTRRAERIPGSQGLAMPRWSYDGRFIAATTFDQHQLKLWDVARRQWRVLARGQALGIPEWSPGSRYLYFQDLLGPGERLLRYNTRAGRISTVADFTAALHDDVYRCAFFGVAPDGSPLMRFDRSGLDLYSATMNWP
ncbi:MAG: winged helix-turn-helix domain-containing protein [Terriglobales bacterium]